MRFVNDDLATALRTLGRLAGQNILISPSVKGTVNLHIENTPWNVVFSGIVNSYGLTVLREDNLLHVMSLEDMKQAVERKSLERQEELVSPLVTKIVPIEFSDPEKIAKSLTTLLSKDTEGKTRGSVTVDEHSRSVILRDIEENIGNLLKVIYDLDKPTPQVLIRAHIVEATKATARELGVQWGAMTNHSSSFQINPGSSQATYSDGGLVYPAPDATSIGQNINFPANSIGDYGPATIGLLLNRGDILLDAQLSALQRDGKLNILSSPSIATQDNAEAVIESGQDVPFQTTDRDGTFEIQYREATLKLTVTPHVIASDMIKMDIETKKDEVDFTETVNGNPLITKKLAKTNLIVKNGETVVIAGLSKETHSNSDSGVPWLKDIPGLGYLFKQESRQEGFQELLIFITPIILMEE